LLHKDIQVELREVNGGQEVEAVPVVEDTMDLNRIQEVELREMVPIHKEEVMVVLV
jgi:hypothetical protein